MIQTDVLEKYLISKLRPYQASTKALKVSRDLAGIEAIALVQIFHEYWSSATAFRSEVTAVHFGSSLSSNRVDRLHT
jgi:hypothetical protein